MLVLFRRSAVAAIILALAAGLVLTLAIRPKNAAAVQAGMAQAIDPAWDYCSAAIARVEREEGIPQHLLAAISAVESGRRHPGTGEVSAWPWTVMAEGRGRYLPSRHAAIAEVRALQARGVRNIDVGCMQINLKYHPKAFSGLEEAFDPAANVAYAAAFLTRLRDDNGSWTKAIGYYHSATPHRYTAYRGKVFAAWREVRRDAMDGEFSTAEAPAPRSDARPAARTATLVAVSPPSSRTAVSRIRTPAQAEPPTLLASLAFGRAGPVELEAEPGS